MSSKKGQGAPEQSLQQKALSNAWASRGAVTFKKPEDLPTSLLQQVLDHELPKFSKRYKKNGRGKHDNITHSTFADPDSKVVFYLNKMLALSCIVSKLCLYKELKMYFHLKVEATEESLMLGLKSGHNDVATEIKRHLKRKYNMQLEWVMN